MLAENNNEMKSATEKYSYDDALNLAGIYFFILFLIKYLSNIYKNMSVIVKVSGGIISGCCVRATCSSWRCTWISSGSL